MHGPVGMIETWAKNVEKFTDFILKPRHEEDFRYDNALFLTDCDYSGVVPWLLLMLE